MSIYVEWLNLNSGATSAILTAVYVLTTVILVIYNHKILKEMKITRVQELKPQVVISFESRRNGLICLIVKNFGGSSAKNMSIKLSEKWLKLLPQKKQEKFRKLKDASLIIVPNQELIFVLGGTAIFSKISEVKLEIKIEYDDLYDKNVSEKFSLDFLSYSNTLLYGTPMDELTSTMSKEMKNINRNLKSINSNFKRVK